MHPQLSLEWDTPIMPVTTPQEENVMGEIRMEIHYVLNWLQWKYLFFNCNKETNKHMLEETCCSGPSQPHWGLWGALPLNTVNFMDHPLVTIAETKSTMLQECGGQWWYKWGCISTSHKSGKRTEEEVRVGENFAGEKFTGIRPGERHSGACKRNLVCFLNQSWVTCPPPILITVRDNIIDMITNTQSHLWVRTAVSL